MGIRRFTPKIILPWPDSECYGATLHSLTVISLEFVTNVRSIIWEGRGISLLNIIRLVVTIKSRIVSPVLLISLLYYWSRWPFGSHPLTRWYIFILYQGPLSMEGFLVRKMCRFKSEAGLFCPFHLIQPPPYL